MEYTHRIYAIAPTVYQLNALKRFHLGCKPRMNGRYYGEQEFYSVEDAEKHLINVAKEYFEGSDDEREAIEDIRHGALTIDGVTAYIEEIEIL